MAAYTVEIDIDHNAKTAVVSVGAWETFIDYDKAQDKAAVNEVVAMLEKVAEVAEASGIHR